MNVKLAEWAENYEPSAMQTLLPLSIAPDILSFSLGLPAVDLFPFETYQQALAEVMKMGASAFQYAPPSFELKKHIAKLMREKNIYCSVDQIFLTTGAQQGISLLARLLLNLNGSIITEEFVYPGLLQAVAPLQPKILTISTDPESGMRLSELKNQLSNGCTPAFIYAMTEGHNPLTVSMSLENRMELVDICKTFKVPVIEDDPYGFLYYTHNTPSLRSFNDEWVYYVGSFSKIVAPSFRIGWLIVPEEISFKLSILKESSDINTATFTQHILLKMLNCDFLNKHLNKLRNEYKLRRDTMVKALSLYFQGTTISYRIPNSGLFIWVELPRHLDAIKLFHHAIHAEKVSFIPGNSFAVDANTGASHCLRLNFSCNSPSQIQAGIRRLARAFKHISMSQ